MGNLFNTIITIPLYNILVALFVFVGDMGIAIILVTIFVRLLLIKQSVKAEKARLEMQKLQPELEKIKKETGKNKEEQAKKMMELYQKKGVSPFSSCGATLIQMPFLIGLFIVFKEGLANGFPLYEPVKNILGNTAVSSTSFGILDLTAIPNSGWFLILPVLAAFLQFVQAKMMTAKAAKSNQTKMTTLLLPGITLIFTMSLPSALSLYWITTTLFAIVQQFVIDKTELKKEFKEAEVVVEKLAKKENK